VKGTSRTPARSCSKSNRAYTLRLRSHAWFEVCVASCSSRGSLSVCVTAWLVILAHAADVCLRTASRSLASQARTRTARTRSSRGRRRSSAQVTCEVFMKKGSTLQAVLAVTLPPETRQYCPSACYFNFKYCAITSWKRCSSSAVSALRGCMLLRLAGLCCSRRSVIVMVSRSTNYPCHSKNSNKCYTLPKPQNMVI
jgi:hypothetical protein